MSAAACFNSIVTYIFLEGINVVIFPPSVSHSMTAEPSGTSGKLVSIRVRFPLRKYVICMFFWLSPSTFIAIVPSKSPVFDDVFADAGEPLLFAGPALLVHDQTSSRLHNNIDNIARLINRFL